MANMHLKQASSLSKERGAPHQTKVRLGWYIRTRFAYAANFGRISEPTSDTNKLCTTRRTYTLSEHL